MQVLIILINEVCRCHCLLVMYIIASVLSMQWYYVLLELCVI